MEMRRAHWGWLAASAPSLALLLALAGEQHAYPNTSFGQEIWTGTGGFLVLSVLVGVALALNPPRLQIRHILPVLLGVTMAVLTAAVGLYGSWSIGIAEFVPDGEGNVDANLAFYAANLMAFGLLGAWKLWPRDGANLAVVAMVWLTVACAHWLAGQADTSSPASWNAVLIGGALVAAVICSRTDVVRHRARRIGIIAVCVAVAGFAVSAWIGYRHVYSADSRIPMFLGVAFALVLPPLLLAVHFARLPTQPVAS